MKQFYSRFRIMLLTFAFGLAVVPFSNFLHEKWTEIPVDLPQAESGSPIFVGPFDYGGGGSGPFKSDCEFTADFDGSNDEKAENISQKASLKDCLFRNKKP